MSSLGEKLTVALAVVFAVSVTALLAQLVCVKWRQRQFRRRSLSVSAGDRESSISGSAGTLTYFYPPSKELLYFFCWNNQSRVEPDVRTPDARPSRPEPKEIDDILKWHGDIYGPPRFLFTISEDQEREVEPEHDDISNSYAASAPPAEEMKKRVSLRDCLEEPQSILVTEAEEKEEEEADDDGIAVAVVSVEATPFSTPCTSPLYFTPSPSPARDHHVTIDTEDDASEFAASDSEAPQFISLEIRDRGIGPEHESSSQ